MIDTRRWLAALLALALLLASAAIAEESAEPPVPEIVEELGEIELPAEVASPEETSGDADSEDAPMAAPAPETPPAEDAPASEAPAVEEVPAEECAVAAPESFPDSLTLGVKEQFSLNGMLLCGGQPVTYASSKPKIASVDENGVVLARKRGAAVITVYLGEAPVGTCAVTVAKAPKKLTFPDKAIVLSAGQVRPYPAALPKGSAGAVTYASDNAAVLAVDGAGNLVGVSGGTATVTATAYNGRKASCAVRVLGGPAPTWVALNETALALPVKGTFQLSASIDAGSDAILTYSSSNRKLVTVSETGLVTAKKAGQATVTVTTHNGLTATCAVQVYIAPKKVSLNVSNLSLYLNDGYMLTATLTKNSISELTWTSDNPGIVSVDQSGMLAANGIGNAVITVTTANGKRATCKVTVLDPNGTGAQGNVVFQQDTETLKVKIIDDRGMILAYVWAADPSRQLFKHYFNGKTEDIMKNAVASNGLSDKLVIGFNCSPPVTDKYCSSWNKHSRYRLKEPSPLLITNGEVLVNEPKDVYAGMYIYWMDGAGWLHATDRTLDQYSVEERQALFQSIIDSGARNTAIWRPILIRDYQPVPFTDQFLKKTGWKQKKHALCQIDEHNFIVVTSSNKGLMEYPQFQRYLMGLGVRTAVEFDAGASSSFMYKARGSDKFYKFVSGRPNTTMMYFTE